MWLSTIFEDIFSSTFFSVHLIELSKFWRQSWILWKQKCVLIRPHIHDRSIDVGISKSQISKIWIIIFPLDWQFFKHTSSNKRSVVEMIFSRKSFPLQVTMYLEFNTYSQYVVCRVCIRRNTIVSRLSQQLPTLLYK